MWKLPKRDADYMLGPLSAALFCSDDLTGRYCLGVVCGVDSD